MSEAIHIALYGVAEPIQFWAMEPPTTSAGYPKIYQVTGEELKRVQYGIDEWKAREEELLGLPGMPASEPDEPLK